MLREDFSRIRDVLSQNLEKVVGVELKGGKKLRGRLLFFDQHLNLVLREADDVSRVGFAEKLGLVIVRGDSVVLIFPSVFKTVGSWGVGLRD